MPIPAPLLRGTRREYNLGHLLESSPVLATQPEERQLLGLVLPPWQRPEVWTLAQQQRFVEGIFLGFDCGMYVINGPDWADDGTSLPMAGWLLDGQQRMSALREFFADRLVVFGDVRFSTLSTPERLRFLRRGFPCLELNYTADEAVLKELYNRLNFGGTPHTAADVVR